MTQLKISDIMTQLKISDIVKKLPFTTHQVNLWWNIGSLHKRDAVIDYDVYLPSKDMNLQRPLCWTLEQKQQLILSIVKRIYIPKLCVLIDQTDSNSPKYQIIDGKQRLSTMLEFLNNGFPLPSGHYFKDCEEDLQMKINSYSPSCEVSYFYDKEPISDEAKIQWFEQINFAGTPQDAAHLEKLKA